MIVVYCWSLCGCGIMLVTVLLWLTVGHYMWLWLIVSLAVVVVDCCSLWGCGLLLVTKLLWLHDCWPLLIHRILINRTKNRVKKCCVSILYSIPIDTARDVSSVQFPFSMHTLRHK